jgi:hypothetical protein
VVRSAVEAIDDLIAEQIRERGDQALRTKIEDCIVAAWNDHYHWIDESLKSGGRSEKPAVPFHLRATAEISNAILVSTGHDLTNFIGVSIANEVLRALTSLTEGAMNIDRDVIIQLGFNPDNLKPLDGEVRHPPRLETGPVVGPIGRRLMRFSAVVCGGPESP